MLGIRVAFKVYQPIFYEEVFMIKYSGFKKFARMTKALALASGLIFGFGSAAEASNLVPYTTFFDTDYSSFGYGGMRNIGTGTITVSGTTGPATNALLYWHGPGFSSSPTANSSVLFNGNRVDGVSLGLSSDNCWGFPNSQAYRADVTPYVTGDGAYSLADFRKPGTADINGVSLVSFYDDGVSANNRDLVIFNGNDSNISNSFDANGWNITLAGINYTSGTAFLEMHVSDGQGFTDDAVKINGINVVPVGANFQGNSTPFGASAATTNGSLWDIRRFDITSFLTPGLNTINMTTGVVSDCLSCVLIGIDLPAGAAPEQPVIPEPSTFLLMGSGIIGAVIVRKRLRKKL